MAAIPDHNNPEVRESEVKVFTQNYYLIDDEKVDTGHRTDYKLHEARVEVLADDNGVFLESKEDGITESLSIPTSDLAVSVAKYILSAYNEEEDTPFSLTSIKFLMPEVQECIAHELWRLSNHITSPHGPVDAQGAPELYGHLKYLADLLDLKMKPHSKYSEGYKPNYDK